MLLSINFCFPTFHGWHTNRLRLLFKNLTFFYLNLKISFIFIYFFNSIFLLTTFTVTLKKDIVSKLMKINVIGVSGFLKISKLKTLIKKKLH